MDRIIEITVKGSYIKKDTKNGGVLGEGNSKYMRIIFDEGWTGLAKKVTFWNAKGLNPKVRTLTADYLTDILVSELDYTIPIPPEPLEFEGEFTYVIDGYEDGKRIRSLADTLEVNYAPMDENAGEPVDPTPTQAEQIQKQIDTLLGDITEQAQIANEAKETVVEHANIATEQAQIATEKATQATNAADSAVISATEAGAASDVAIEKALEAKTSAQSATESANSAKNSATEAENSATQAANSATSASESAKTVDEKINGLDENVNIATQAAQTATTKANEAKESATNATNAATSASANATAAEKAATEAKNYAEQAEAAAGGDFVTRPELQESIKDFATEEYVDEALANFEGGGGITEIPVASADTLGGIKIGEGLNITADGVLSTIGGEHGHTVLWEGELKTDGATATLSDDYENYDFILVEASVIFEGKRYAITTNLLDVSTIANATSLVFNIWNAVTTAHYYRLTFGFTDNKTFVVGKATVTSTQWSLPQINKVIGIKLGGNYIINGEEFVVDRTPTADSGNLVTSGGVKTYVDGQISAVNTTLGNKADTTYVDNQISTVNTALLNKADTNYVNNRVLMVEQTVATKAVVKKFSATIPTTGWTSSFPYTVTIAIDGMLASDSNFPVSPVYSDTLSTRMAQAEAWGKVTMIAAGNNSIVVTCDEEIPMVEIPIQITVVR